MSYDDGEEQTRVVVNTPTSSREVVRTETTLVPVREGISTGAVAAIVVGAVALVTILFLFLMKSNQDAVNNNTPVATTQPQQQQPIVIQPGQTSQQPIYVQPGTTQPVIVQQVPVESAAVANGTDDASIQSNIDRKISEDTTLASLGVSALVVGGRVTLTGTVNSDSMKSRVERVINDVKGVRGVDNKIVVMSTSH